MLGQGGTLELRLEEVVSCLLLGTKQGETQGICHPCLPHPKVSGPRLGDIAAAIS